MRQKGHILLSLMILSLFSGAMSPKALDVQGGACTSAAQCLCKPTFHWGPPRISRGLSWAYFFAPSVTPFFVSYPMSAPCGLATATVSESFHFWSTHLQNTSFMLSWIQRGLSLAHCFQSLGGILLIILVRVTH
jgi:hypothetical protein